MKIKDWVNKLTKKEVKMTAEQEELKKIENELRKLNEIAVALTEGRYHDELVKQLLEK